MFNADALTRLKDDHKETLSTLRDLEDALSARFYGMDATVNCMILAALTGEAMVMIGPPGTAKSRLIRSFCNLLGLIDDDGLSAMVPGAPKTGNPQRSKQQTERYFEYLLTQFTEPSELFGQFDLAKLFDTPPSLTKDETAMMQRAEVVFLDEVFNASSAILNALLTFMNERKFHDRGRVQMVPLQLLFAATNHAPREDGLGAFYDRFLLRSRLHNTSADPERLAHLVSAAWTETHGLSMAPDAKQKFKNLLPGVEKFRRDLDARTKAGEIRIEMEDPLFRNLADLVEELRRKDLSQMSNRRLVKFAGIILAKALLRTTRQDGPARILPEDLAVILDYGLDAEDDSTVRKLRATLGA